MSLSCIKDIEDVRKQNRFYLRYYLTIKKARELNKKIYGNKRTKNGKEWRIEHPIRVASATEQIKNQSISNYHMTWLVGLLHDSKEDGFMIFSQEIDQVLKDLLKEQRERVILYIDQLTSDESIEKGNKKKNQVDKMKKIDVIPSWIRIFDKYDNCKRFLEDPAGKTQQQIKEYCAIGYLCYSKAIERFEEIKTNLQPQIKQFYEKLQKDLGGLKEIKILAESYYKRE